ncbi:MAG: DNA repair protein RecN [Alphaproteobacteria bacterium]|jgi:DNA repair protein RecN (Recombination protein N)|nr:DNA repair protein RecN [Candidatus Jidaibacter sp.]
MILSIYLKNYIIIDELEINFSTGFNVITGETGAGKSIALEGLLLSLCARQSTKGTHKNNAEPLILSSSFDIENNVRVRQILEEYGVVLENSSEIIVRRVIQQDGKSKSYINNQPAAVGLVKAIGDELIEYTGQHSNFKLLNSAKHLDLFDEFALDAGIKSDLKQSYHDYKVLRNKLDELINLQENSEIEKQYLEHAISEISGLNTYPEEATEIAAKRKALQDRQKLIDICKKVSDICESVNFPAKFAQIQRELSKFDEYFSSASKAIDATFAEYDEFQTQFDELMNGIGTPSELESLEERLFKIMAISRKYNVPPVSLSPLLEEFEEKISKLHNVDAEIRDTEKKLADARQFFLKIAKSVSSIRATESENLTNSIKDTLSFLKMEKANFVVQIDVLEKEEHWSENGIDKVRFMASTNPGSPMGDIAKIASGGELSRIMLSLKLALASKDSAISLIFDEVDSGLSGATANAVGKKLKDLSSRYQVLCITHQPQVACYSDQHFFVEKVSNENNTMFNVSSLDDEEKVKSIARMISGDSITNESIEAARVLINQS